MLHPNKLGARDIPETADTERFIKVTGYLNAGGRGTRLNDVFIPDPEYGIAKALLKVGTPEVTLLDHHVANLGSMAVSQIVIGAGDLKNVSDYAEDTYTDIDNVHVATAPAQFGTGGDLLLAMRERPGLFANQTMISNVDTVVDHDSDQLFRAHHFSGAALTVVLTRNKGVPNEGAFHVDEAGIVKYCAEAAPSDISYASETRISWRGSSTGVVIADTGFLRGIDWGTEDGQLSIYRDIMRMALRQRLVAGYDNGHRFMMDVGTAHTWREQLKTGALQRYLRYLSQQEQAA